MFEAITLTGQNSNASEPLDMGSLVEAMLFYGKVTVVANIAIFEQIYQYFGGENLLKLLEEKFLEIVYQEQCVGILTNKYDNDEFHSPINFSSPQYSFANKLREQCIDARGKRGAGRRLAQRFERYIRIENCETPNILRGAQEAILNQKYVESSAKIIINELVPVLPSNKYDKFSTYDTDKGTVVETNFDFKEINQAYHKLTPSAQIVINPAYILNHILKLEEELFFAAAHLSELSCSNISSRLGMNKIDYLIERSLVSKEKFANFKNTFLSVKSIREVVNKNAMNFDKLFNVLKNSRCFKTWAKDLSPNDDLVEEYLKEINRLPYIETLPGKIIRFCIFSSAGLVLNPVAGIALGAVEAFFVDRICKGWKPNQYIERDLRSLN